MWTWNKTDRTIRSKSSDECLTVPQELEVWSNPLSDSSQAVVLLNRADSGSEEITVQCTDIGLTPDHPATARDLWVRNDLGMFTGNSTSPKIDSHAVMMLNITVTK